MRKLVVTDIYGKTARFEALCRSLGAQTDIIDPYGGQYFNFSEESVAYNHFMNNVGISHYSKILIERLKSISHEIELIGFSVGASAIWKISDRLKPEICKKMICFYGSQIRHYQTINPCIPVELVLPAYEPGFDVDELSKKLSDKTLVKIRKTSYLHGFMNYHSKNYNPEGYRVYVGWLNQS